MINKAGLMGISMRFQKKKRKAEKTKQGKEKKCKGQ